MLNKKLMGFGKRVLEERVSLDDEHLNRDSATGVE